MALATTHNQAPHSVFAVSMAGATITLGCLLLGEKSPFEVSTALSASVDSLKEAIKAKLSPELSDIAASKLDLWKVNVPFFARATIRDNALNEEDAMQPLKKVKFYFSGLLEEEHIHVVVRRPQGEC